MRVKFTDDGCKGLFSYPIGHRISELTLNRAGAAPSVWASRGSGGLSLRKTPSTLTGTRLLALPP
jgi:hypothetical protein